MYKFEELIYIGVDLHKEHHTAVIIDCWNQKLGELKFDNKPSAFPSLEKYVKKLNKKGKQVVYGLEDVGGFGRALAVYLVEKGHIVKEVNAKLANARRKSHTTVVKSDVWDAECVARVLRDELSNLPDAKPIDHYWIISQLVNQRKSLVKVLSSDVKRLHQQISYHYPSYKKFFTQIEGKTALAFWDKYPAPIHLQMVDVEALANFLRSQSNNGLSTKKAEQILELIANDGNTTRDYQEQRDFIIRQLVNTIRHNKQEITKVEEQLAFMMSGLGMKLETMTGIDTVTASEFVAEIGDIHRFQHEDKLARFAGVAPVAVGSGNKHRNHKSKQGNRVLHDLFKALAIRQIAVTRTKKEPRNSYFYAYYESRIRAGKTKQQAIVCVMRKLVRVIYYLMKTKEKYEIPFVSSEEVA